MRIDWDTYFMTLAFAAATRATCPRKHVGAILVDKQNRVLATGYNGSPPGKPHCDDIGCLMMNGRCVRTIHAEDNAIYRVGWWRRRGSTMYCTHFPCYRCSRLISRAGIIQVVYGTKLKRSPDDVLELFLKEGIVVRQHSLVTQLGRVPGC